MLADRGAGGPGRHRRPRRPPRARRPRRERAGTPPQRGLVLGDHDAHGNSAVSVVSPPERALKSSGFAEAVHPRSCRPGRFPIRESRGRLRRHHRGRRIAADFRCRLKALSGLGGSRVLRRIRERLARGRVGRRLQAVRRSARRWPRPGFRTGERDAKFAQRGESPSSRPAGRTPRASSPTRQSPRSARRPSRRAGPPRRAWATAPGCSAATEPSACAAVHRRQVSRRRRSRSQP